MELLVPLFAIAIAVWLIPIVLRGGVIPLAVVMLLTGTVFGPFFYAIDGPIQISLDRVLWLATMGMVLVGWRLGDIQFPKLGRVDWLMIGLTAFLLFSAIRGGDGPGTTQISPIARWLFYVFMPLGVYAVGRVVRLDTLDVRWVFGGLQALGLYLAFTGICEVRGMHWAVFPTYIRDPEVWVFYGRARGPLMNPIVNGFLMSVGLMVTVVQVIRCGRVGKVLNLIAVMVLLLGVYSTLTRSCWIGAIAAITLVGMQYSPRWVRVLGLASAVFLVGAMAFGLKDQLLAIKRDKALSAEESAKSVELRPLLAVVAYEMFKDKPIAGHGFGHYFENNGPFHNIPGYDLPLETVREYQQHNTFLALLVDGGLLGTSMFCLGLLVFFVIGWQLMRRRGCPAEARYVGILMMGTIAIYLVNGMFHDLIVIPMIQMFLMFIAGLSVNVHGKGIKGKPVHPETSPRGAAGSQMPTGGAGGNNTVAGPVVAI